MKLYNLLNDVIIEESKKHIRLLTEGVDLDNVRNAIDDKYMVNIMYKPEDDVLSKRYVAVYNLGKTKSGNDAIRVYQVSGGNRKKNDWKTFRLDRIEGWEPTKMKWYNPISDYDSSIPKYKINRDKTFSVLNKSVDPTKFGNPRGNPKSEPTNVNKTEPSIDTQDRTDMVKVPELEPDDDFIPEPESKEKPIDNVGNNDNRKVKVPPVTTTRKVKTTTNQNTEEPEIEQPEIEDDEENNENN